MILYYRINPSLCLDAYFHHQFFRHRMEHTEGSAHGTKKVNRMVTDILYLLRIIFDEHVGVFSTFVRVGGFYLSDGWDGVSS